MAEGESNLQSGNNSNPTKLDATRPRSRAQICRTRLAQSSRRLRPRSKTAIVGEGFHVYDQRDHAESLLARRRPQRQRINRLCHPRTMQPHRTNRSLRQRFDRSGRLPRSSGHRRPQPRREWSWCRTSTPSRNHRRRRSHVRRSPRTQRRLRTLHPDRLPFVTLKAGLSLDGRIAPAPETRTL